MDNSLQTTIATTNGTQRADEGGVGIPNDFYWPWRFIPAAEESTTQTPHHGGTKLHQLCVECKKIRDWLFANLKTGVVSQSLKLPPITFEPEKFWPHHRDTGALVRSAYAGCHLCSLLYPLTYSRGVWGDPDHVLSIIPRYELAFRRIEDTLSVQLEGSAGQFRNDRHGGELSNTRKVLVTCTESSQLGS